MTSTDKLYQKNQAKVKIKNFLSLRSIIINTVSVNNYLYPKVLIIILSSYIIPISLELVPWSLSLPLSSNAARTTSTTFSVELASFLAIMATSGSVLRSRMITSILKWDSRLQPRGRGAQPQDLLGDKGRGLLPGKPERPLLVWGTVSLLLLQRRCSCLTLPYNTPTMHHSNIR